MTDSLTLLPIFNRRLSPVLCYLTFVSSGWRRRSTLPRQASSSSLPRPAPPLMRGERTVSPHSAPEPNAHHSAAPVGRCLCPC